MPRKKTEELAIIVPETPVLPPTTEDAADQPLVGNTVPENTTEPAAEEIEPVEEAKAESAEYPVQELSTPAAVVEPENAQPAETPPKRTTRKRAAPKKAPEIVDKDQKTPAEASTVQTVSEPAIQQRDILTLDARSEAETQAQLEDIIWHEIHNAYRTRRILSGKLSGIEKTDTGKTIAIVDYKGFRIVIPMKEMVADFPQGMHGAEYDELILRYKKILNNMLGAEVDFVVKGIDAKSRTVVASRMDAMLKKRQIYYLGKDSDGRYRIYDGRVVEARVIAVAEKVITTPSLKVKLSSALFKNVCKECINVFF